MLPPRVFEGMRGLNHDYSIYRLKCFAVTELLISRNPLGSPAYNNCPPCLPANGPMSINPSASVIIVKLCSIKITVFPLSIK